MSYSFAGRYFDKCKPFFSYGCDDYAFKVDLEFGCGSRYEKTNM